MGLAQTAEAQTVPVQGTTISQQQQYEKPWAHDRSYVAQIDAAQRGVNADIRQAKANETKWLAEAQQRYSQEVQREANWAASMRANPKTKWSDWSALAAHQNTAATTLNASQVGIHAKTDAYIAKREADMENYTLRLDQQYERMPQYKIQNPFTGANPTTQPAAKPALPGANQSLSPEQQHERLVRAYQDQQLKAAQSGGKIAMPKPADFGLDAKDPAIQPGGMR